MSGKLEGEVETDAVGEQKTRRGRPIEAPNAAPNAENNFQFTAAASKAHGSITISAPNSNIHFGQGDMIIYDTAKSYGEEPLCPIPPELPVIKSTAIPDGTAIDIVARTLGKCWRQLGRALGLQDGEMDNVRLDHCHEGQYEVSYQMLMKWKQQGYPVELGRLAQKLVEIGRGDIADALANTFSKK